MTGYQIADRLGISKTTVYKHLGLGKKTPRWTEAEIQRLTDMRYRAKTYKQIAKELGRSETAVKVKVHRRRQEIRADPRKRLALRMITRAVELGAEPGQAIAVVRKAKIL